MYMVNTIYCVSYSNMYLQGVLQCVIKFHDCRLISTTITIVWCAEDRHYITVMAPIVALCNKLTMLIMLKLWHVRCFICCILLPIRKKKNYQVPPLPAGGLLRPKLGRLHGWKFRKCPARRCNQHHGERCPNHHGHLGLTITSHTLDPEKWRKPHPYAYMQDLLF